MNIESLLQDQKPAYRSSIEIMRTNGASSPGATESPLHHVNAIQQVEAFK